MIITESILNEFDQLINQISLMFEKFDRTKEPPLTVMEVYAVIPTYAQLLHAGKEHSNDEELKNIILVGIKILKSTIKTMIEIQPDLEKIGKKSDI